MSRIGLKPILIPDKVKVDVKDSTVHFEGPKGKASYAFPELISGKVDGKFFIVVNNGETRQSRALHGLARSLVANHLTGVSHGFQKKLEIQGVGFKAEVTTLKNITGKLTTELAKKEKPDRKIVESKRRIEQLAKVAAPDQKVLDLSLGFSHSIYYIIPPEVKVTVSESVNILIEGSDKQIVGAVAADIRAFYPPEPYKGKGVRYSGEHIIRKEGKTAQSK